MPQTWRPSWARGVHVRKNLRAPRQPDFSPDWADRTLVLNAHGRFDFAILSDPCATVAQLDRARAYEARGCRFDSCRSRFPPCLLAGWFVFEAPVLGGSRGGPVAETMVETVAETIAGSGADSRCALLRPLAKPTLLDAVTLSRTIANRASRYARRDGDGRSVLIHRMRLRSQVGRTCSANLRRYRT